MTNHALALSNLLYVEARRGLGRLTSSGEFAFLVHGCFFLYPAVSTNKIDSASPSLLEQM